MRRSDQRRAAVFALYQEEVTGRSTDEALDAAPPFSCELVEGVESHREELDTEIAALAAQVAEWAAQDEANRPKAKRAAGLHVIPEGKGGGAVRANAQKVE